MQKTEKKVNNCQKKLNNENGVETEKRNNNDDQVLENNLINFSKQ